MTDNDAIAARCSMLQDETMLHYLSLSNYLTVASDKSKLKMSVCFVVTLLLMMLVPLLTWHDSLSLSLSLSVSLAGTTKHAR